MDEKIAVALQELKEAVARKSGTWHQHAASLAIMLVVTATSAYMGSYLQTRGESAAIADNLEAIKHQLSETTRTAEGIKSEISKRSEVNSLRVRKLEELFEGFLNFRTQHRIALEQVQETSAGKSRPSISSAKILMLARFYVPDVADSLELYVQRADTELGFHWQYDKNSRASLTRDLEEWEASKIWENAEDDLAAAEFGRLSPYVPSEDEIWREFVKELNRNSEDAAYDFEHRLEAAMSELLNVNVSP